MTRFKMLAISCFKTREGDIIEQTLSFLSRERMFNEPEWYSSGSDIYRYSYVVCFRIYLSNFE